MCKNVSNKSIRLYKVKKHELDVDPRYNKPNDMAKNLLLHHNSYSEASLSINHRSSKKMEVPNECPILA